MKRILAAMLCALLLLVLCSCGQLDVLEEQLTGENLEGTIIADGQEVSVDEELDLSGFTADDFSVNETTGRIECLTQEALTGIDVSSHQGEIDWPQVAQNGISFAILRIGNRGYTQGGLNQDTSFETNYEGATANGLKVGVYFFSQAISVEEAEEEAEFILSILNGRALDLPVVFDWETIDTEEARTDHVDMETCTACVKAFGEKIQSGGYDYAFYCNSSTGYFQYDLAQLQDIDAWYAEYGSWPRFVYLFQLWQYSNSGTVAGIDTSVDMDLWFPYVEAEE